jgi:hypothetical protein
MTAQRKRKTAGAEEVRLLGLLLSGDIAGFEQATGKSMREMELRMRATGELADADLIDDEPGDDEPGDDEGDENEDVFYFDDEEDDWRLRPEWLHADCVDPCAALDLGTCCKYPVSPLVRRALELADSVDRVLREAGPGAGDLTRLLRSVPGLLAQVHAVLPSLDRTSAAQLTCPVGRLASSLGPGGPRHEAESEALGPLVEACSDALWATLRSHRRLR